MGIFETDKLLHEKMAIKKRGGVLAQGETDPEVEV